MSCWGANFTQLRLKIVLIDKPDKSLTVHAMKDKVDLTNIVQPENVVSQKIRTLAERLQDINQPSDRWD